MKPNVDTKLVESKIFTHDDQDDHDPMIWLIYGKPAAGKTTAALSISSYWPEKFPSPKDVLLRDVLAVSWDPAGRVGTKAGKIRCAYAVNALSLFASRRRKSKRGDFTPAKDITAAIKMVAEEVGNLVMKDEQIRFCIDDTVTFLNYYLESHFGDPEHIPETKGEEEDTRKMYGLIKRWHLIYLTSRLMLPEDVTSLFLFHGRSFDDVESIKDKKEKKRQAMVRINSNNTIMPAITGGALDVYTGAASVEFALIPTVPPENSKVDPERRLYTVPAQGYRAKNRLPKGVLADVETLPLKNVMKKISDACGWK